MEQFIFTPDNLIANLDKLGGWSSYGLASIALQHYFPEEYDEDGNCNINRELELMDKIECKTWDEAIIKYHSEVGYKGEFDPGSVNIY